MSGDEDTELRDLVAQTLEYNGTLGKIRAQLRASVFLALEEHENSQGKAPFLNKELKHFLSTKEGKMAAGLVREFLEFFGLEFTLAVFDPETGTNGELENRAALAKELSLPDAGGSGKAPLLVEVLRHPTTSTTAKHISVAAEQGSQDVLQIPKTLTQKQITDAREKFDFYDKDSSGSIDKDELRDLFLDMFPSFHRNMLERYVNDEFKASDRDFSSSIDFEEFLGMYKRLFLLCKTVVVGDVDDLISEKSNKAPPPLPATPPPTLPKLTTNGPARAPVDPFTSFGSDPEDDPFFDDPVPVSGSQLKHFSSAKTRGDWRFKPNEGRSSPVGGWARGGGRASPVGGRPTQIPVYHHGLRSESPDPAGGGASNKSAPRGSDDLTSLDDQPSLGDSFLSSAALQSSESNLRPLDKRFEEMTTGDKDDEFEYEDDFLSEGQSISTSLKGPGVTRTDSKNENGSIVEEIEEDIEEDLLGNDDLLNEKSEADDLTLDVSVSQVDNGFDYAEEVELP